VIVGDHPFAEIAHESFEHDSEYTVTSFAVAGGPWPGPTPHNEHVHMPPGSLTGAAAPAPMIRQPWN
jgi:hypothetical protein